MKRKTELVISRCFECPWLEIVDSYSTHHYLCSKLNISTVESDGDQEKRDLILIQLNDWYNDLCPLEEVKQ